MRESLIENDGVEYAEARGWLVYKWSSPGNTGVLDRIHFKDCFCFAIEYKATGKKASPKQRKEAEKLKAAGIPARCFGRVSNARNFISTITAAVSIKSPISALAYMRHLAQDISSFNE